MHLWSKNSQFRIVLEKPFLYCSGANSSLVHPGDSRELAEKILVTQITLDDYLSVQQCPEPRLIKIDTEGAEIRILKGAQRCLSGGSRIICELHPYAWPDFGNSLDELKELVKASGRRIRYLDQDNEIGDKATYGVAALEH
jgi:Methyltransferase FkbM domain